MLCSHYKEKNDKCGNAHIKLIYLASHYILACYSKEDDTILSVDLENKEVHFFFYIFNYNFYISILDIKLQALNVSYRLCGLSVDFLGLDQSFRYKGATSKVPQGEQFNSFHFPLSQSLETRESHSKFRLL